MTDQPAFGTTVAEYTGTIPRLLQRAGERDRDGIWLRTDERIATFGQAAGLVSGMAAILGDLGVGHGDLVMLTTRTTPEYLLTWLALASIGAVTVPVNPASSLAEFSGLLGQVEPVVVVTDADLDPVISEAVRQASGGGGHRVHSVLNVNRLDEEAGRSAGELPIDAASPHHLALP